MKAMNRVIGYSFGVIACLLFCGKAIATTGSNETTASLIVRADAPGKPISADLVGVFFEDLNYAADGGLYAELIQNRSFEYSATEQSTWGPLSFWDLVKTGEGDGFLEIGEVRPVHRNNPHYLLLNVKTAGEGVGVSNPGFDGIPVWEGKAYRASFWSYQTYMNEKWGPDSSTDGRPMPMTLRLESRNGEVLAEKKLEVSGRAWTRYEVELTPLKSDPKARLVLLAHAQGGLAVDVVSLFPMDTFKGRENGLRKDLAQTIADIQPKFVRFPGGCLVHGHGLYHYYDWKDTVGPVEQRRERRNLWGYHQTMGLGYYEYFQFCEDIGAIPLPVVAAGVSCQHSGDSPGRGQDALPMGEMPGYIQDVLDLIEWANGPAESKWGAVRAAAGHPKPFGLRYLGVGNEDEITPAFKERFRMIRDVLLEKHPEIVVVGTSGPFASGPDYERGWAFANELGLAMVDEHYYLPPQWFWDNQTRYDAYDRKGSAVYVGEYAAHEPDRRNTLRSALAEAVGLIGFERNGDVVKFASYAPLLARRGNTQWIPDMIYFSGTEVFRTPNYYVQQMFGRNGGDRLLPTELSGEGSLDRVVCSAVADSVTEDRILKVINGGSEAVSFVIQIEGTLPDDGVEGACVVLSGPTLDAVNQDGSPESVCPRQSTVQVKPVFQYVAPAHSLTMLRWR